MAAEKAAESIKAMLAEDAPPPRSPLDERMQEAKAQAGREMAKLAAEVRARAVETARPHQGLPYAKPKNLRPKA